MNITKEELGNLVRDVVAKQVDVLRSSGKPTDGMMNLTAVGDFQTGGMGGLELGSNQQFYTTPQGSVINLANNQAPWVRLSPEMAEFAEGVKQLLQGKQVSRTLVEGSDPSGGYLIPEEFSPTIVEYKYEQLCMWGGATVWPMNTDKIGFPKLAQRPDEDSADFDHFSGILFTWTEEGGTKEETQPDFEFLELIAHEFSGYTEATNALIEDSPINLLNWLTGLFRRAYLYFTDRSFIRGNGARTPLGVCSDPAVLTVNRATAGAVTYADILALDSKLPSVFDQGAVWLASKKVLNSLRGQVDTNGQPILQQWYQQGPPGIGTGLVTYMLGYPVIRSDGRTYNLGARGDILLINRSYYYIGQRKNFRFDTSKEFRFRNNLQAFRVCGRIDGVMSFPEAAVILDLTESAS